MSTFEEIDGFDSFIIDLYDKMRTNKHKKGTPRGVLSKYALLTFLKIEVQELEAAMEYLSDDDVKKEACDVSAFCMLIHKRLSRPLEET